MVATRPAQPIWLVEIEAGSPAHLTLTPQPDAWGTLPWATSRVTPESLEDIEVIRASDGGYRSRTTDDGGVRIYLPRLTQTLSFDRQLPLTPGADAKAAWGSVYLASGDGRYDAAVAGRTVQRRAARIYYAERRLDAARGYWVDPPWAEVAQVFGGMSESWSLSDTELSVALRDATYWLGEPLQQGTYGGTGGLDGTADMAGTRLPKARGIVLNATPVLIDATNRIYQVSDAAISGLTVYEGGAAVFTSAGDTADLYSGSTPAGAVRTCLARGLFQLGSSAKRQITCDVTGAFPSAGSVTSLYVLLKAFLIEDCGLPAEYLDDDSFAAAAAAAPYPAGVYWQGDDTDGLTAATSLAASAGGVLVPARSGKLGVLLMRPPPATGEVTWTEDDIVSITPQDLPDGLSPPAYRWRVGYGHNYTVQTSDFDDVATDDRKKWLAQEWSYAVWADASVRSLYPRPSDPDALATALADQAGAQATANALGALWGVRRRLYSVAVPIAVGTGMDLGRAPHLLYPLDDLRNGRVGVIVGEQIRSYDGTITYAVLV